jgi:uncharacterized membrane protein YgcG
MKLAFTICGTVAAAVFIAGTAVVSAQTTPAAAPAAAPAEGTPNKTPPFKKEELEAIVAPIALYPDALLAQIFMASTYPLEIVEAARWSKAHPDVKGDAVAGAVQKETWDPSVKSLCAFPSVLSNMNEKIDWTQKLGDAFLAQQKEVMQAVQVLRGKAKETGNLKSTKEVTVKEEPAPAGSPAPQTIIIESPDPEVVYVPTYNTATVYGAWGYPYYPPYSYYPPGYAYGAAFWSFTAGVIVGGAIWGNCNWGGNDVDIDINRQNNFNRNEINNNRNNVNSNNRTGNNNRAGNNSGNKQSWQHNSEHRKGVGYKDSATQQKFNRGSSQQATQAREQYRGRAEQGREQISREGVGNQRDLAGNSVGSRDAGARDMGGASTRDLNSGTRDLGGNNAGTRDLGGASTRDLGGGSRDSSSRDFGGSSSRGSSSSAFGGAGRSSGASTRSSSSRGGASRGGGMSRGGGGRRR